MKGTALFCLGAVMAWGTGSGPVVRMIVAAIACLSLIGVIAAQVRWQDRSHRDGSWVDAGWEVRNR